MPNIHELIPSKYIKKDDIGPGALCTIRAVARENVGTEENQEEKVVITFDEFDKKFVCNLTNIYAIVAVYGEDYSEWLGKKIVLYFDPTVQFKGKVTGGIRVRAPKGAIPEPDLPF
jgi:hypothetical protein